MSRVAVILKIFIKFADVGIIRNLACYIMSYKA